MSASVELLGASPARTEVAVDRLAITGSSGFVGRRLVARARAAGHPVEAVTRHGAAGGRRVVSYVDVDSLTAAFEGCSHVVHLAARAHVLRERADDASAAFEQANAQSAAAVAVAARRAGVRRVVLVSSIGVNGNRTAGRPFAESDLPSPREPYAVSKWHGEQRLAVELAAGPTDYVVLRPPLVYGPGCPGNFRLLINLVRRLPLVPMGALHRSRSLIHVDNLCDAILCAARHEAASRRTFVLSDGEDLSVAEIVRVLVQACGKPASSVVSVPEPVLRAAAALVGRAATFDKLAGELLVDSRAFREAIGWSPPRSAREALAETMRDDMALRADGPAGRA